MTRLRRITVIDQAEMDIEKRVRAGEWNRRLPGFKALAELVGVSVPTIGVAVARLVARGILVSQGPRRPFVVAPNLAKAAAAKAKVRTKYLVIVSREPLQEMNSWMHAFSLDLMRKLAREGWRCDLEELVSGGRNLRRSLDCLRRKHPSSHLLFLGGTSDISDWAAAHPEVAVAFLGGRSNHPRVPVIGFAIPVVYGDILNQLTRLGHRRVLTALWDPNPHMAEVIGKLHAEHHKLAVGQLADSGLYIHSSIANPARRKEEFLRAFRKSKPTAIVVDGLFEYILVWTTLMELGLKVPGDISIINLFSDSQFAKLPLVPSHHRIEPELVIREIHGWIRGRPADAAAAARRVIALPLQGNTLAPAPRRG